MDSLKRTRFQGLTNIIRFNRHFYMLAILFIAALLLIKSLVPPLPAILIIVLIWLIGISTVVSLLVSHYLYDRSGLYSLDWLGASGIEPKSNLINIHAGFDETSALLQMRYPEAKLLVYDFYDPKKHTEISIKRARKAYPAFPGTKTLNTENALLPVQCADAVFLIFAAHEIRQDAERIRFFRQLAGSLTATGKIIVLEHERNMYNFVAYNFGFFHFLLAKTWKKTFAAAGLIPASRQKLTPFLTLYHLKNHGAIS